MDDSFNFDRILRANQKKHKQKPAQFGSVACGVKKRLEDHVKNRKSVRTTQFDNFRQLSNCEGPVSGKATTKLTKMEERLLRLEKWKTEKEKKKKEAATHKIKPFVTGVIHHPLNYIPPPPPPRLVARSRVTRSQSAILQNATSQSMVNQVNNKAVKSFAPINANFKPPAFETVPKLEPVINKKKKSIINYTFNPIMPSTSNQKNNKTGEACETHANTKKVFAKDNRNKTAAKQRKNKEVTKIKGSIPKLNRNNLMISSSSESENIYKADTEEMSVTQVTSSNQKLMDNPSLTKVEMQHTDAITKKFNAKDRHNKTVAKQRNNKEVKKIKSSTPNLNKNNYSSSSSSESESIYKADTEKMSVTQVSKITPKKTSEAKLQTSKSYVMAVTPEQIEEAKKISPNVTMSRGKDNARREFKKKIEEGVLDDDACDIDSVNHFRRQLNSEINRINEMCDVWDNIREQTSLPESIEEAARGAVGQGRLLVSQKLRQFASLVERCARPEPGTALVTPADLQGFWDMVYIQVENIDLRFKKLATLRQRNWQEEEPAAAKPKAVVKNNPKKPVRATAGPSRLREMIAAARKAKKQQDATPQKPLGSPTVQGSRTFEAGFFNVVSPMRNPVQVTPARKSLLKAVLSSEAKKSSAKSASFAILRASVLSKSMDQEGIAPLPSTPVNLNATPGPSILKSARAASGRKSGKKSIKLVLFGDEDHDKESSEDKNGDNEIQEKEKSIDDVGLATSHGGVFSIVDEKDDHKENSSRRRSKLIRQDAFDYEPVRTRSRSKSMNTPNLDNTQEKTTRRSHRTKKVLQETLNVK